MRSHQREKARGAERCKVFTECRGFVQIDGRIVGIWRSNESRSTFGAEEPIAVWDVFGCRCHEEIRLVRQTTSARPTRHHALCIALRSGCPLQVEMANSFVFCLAKEIHQRPRITGCCADALFSCGDDHGGFFMIRFRLAGNWKSFLDELDEFCGFRRKQEHENDEDRGENSADELVHRTPSR